MGHIDDFARRRIEGTNQGETGPGHDPHTLFGSDQNETVQNLQVVERYFAYQLYLTRGEGFLSPELEQAVRDGVEQPTTVS